MLDQVSKSNPGLPDPVGILIHHLETGNDVLRTGAVRALSQQTHDLTTDPRIRNVLLGALMDEDVDVRTDAMVALTEIADASDVDVIRNSLIGDPVREVKLAAINILTRLKDEKSILVFANLVTSRAENEFEWEDENDVWDDWLEIQTAVIGALGELKATQTIPVLMAARDDEYGQNLDVAVFQAFLNMGDEGVAQLIEIAQSETGTARKRALEMLAKANSDVMFEHLDFLLQDESSDVRRLAIPLINSTSKTAADLVLKDLDPVIRLEALAYHGAENERLVISALVDADEGVLAKALSMLESPLPNKLNDAIISNMPAWLSLSGSQLCIAALGVYPKLTNTNAVDPLLKLARDVDKALEVRLAAIDALAECKDEAATQRMIGFLGNESQQVRVKAATYLASFAKAEDEAAIQALILAADGLLLAPDKAVVKHDETTDPAHDPSASNMDQEADTRLKISPDGEVIHTDVKLNATPLSTLEAIQMTAIPDKPYAETGDLAEDTPEESSTKRRKRRAVEGPEKVGEDLARFALDIIADISDKKFEDVIITATQSVDEIKRLRAYKALAKRQMIFNNCFDDVKNFDVISVGLSDKQPAIRSIAAEIVANSPIGAENTINLEEYVNDDDAMVRAASIRLSNDTDVCYHFLSDSSSLVRRAALERLLISQPLDDLDLIFDRLLKTERSDVLMEAFQTIPSIKDRLFDKLSEAENTPKMVHVMLQALANTSEISH